MSWFSNLKTAQKIIGLVLFMIVVILSVGFAGYKNAKNADDAMELMYSDALMPIMYLNSSLAKVNNIKSNVLDIILQKNNKFKQAARLDEINQLREEYKGLLTEYEKCKLSNEEKSLLNTFKDNLSRYRDINNNVINLALKGKSEEAYKVLQYGEPIYNKYVDALRQLAKLSEKEALEIKDTNDKNAETANQLMIGFILLASILSAIIGVYISKMIANPLSEILKNVQEVAKGDLTVDEVSIKSTDEVGQLGVAFNLMTKNLRILVDQVSRSIQEVSASAQEVTASAEQTAQGAQQVTQSITQLSIGSQQISKSVTDLSYSSQQSAKSVSQLAQGSQQIAASVSQLATGTQSQAKGINDILENIGIINKAIKVASDGAVNSVKISKATETNALEGNKQADKAVVKINQIKNVSSNISGTIAELGKLSSGIEQIVDLIKSIAGQTNLLALNAAIEAARAGEHGKGFAVVAEEVKKLAGQSADATDKITAMVKEIQNKTNDAVMAMNQGIQEVEEGVVIVDSVGHSLKDIFQAAKDNSVNVEDIAGEISKLVYNTDEVAKMMESIASITDKAAISTEEISSITEETAAGAEEIASVTQEQTASLEDVSSIVEQSAASAQEISAISQEQAASLEEINVACQSLTKIAENLQKLVSVFKI